MSTVIEKVIIPLLILTCIAISIYNPMQFDLSLRFLAGTFVIGLLVLLAFWLNRQNRQPLQVTSPLLSSLNNVNPLRPEASSSDVSPTSLARVNGDITPILKLYGSHTISQMNNLLTPYKGRSVQFSGVVVDVYPPDSNNKVRIFLTPEGSTSFSSLKFSKEWNSYFHAIQKGVKLTVAAEIDDIDAHGVHFKNCSIIP
jgi:hypothetical protein